LSGKLHGPGLWIDLAVVAHNLAKTSITHRCSSDCVITDP
jgi:hypothetical protein